MSMAIPEVGKRSIHRVPMETAEKVLALYQERYFDLSVRHFHEKLQEEHGLRLSYSWVKQGLQGAGLIAKRKRRGSHRRRRARRPMPGMLLHIDGSKHRWFQDDRYYDLIVILDDATSEIYYAQLVEEESTRTVIVATAGCANSRRPPRCSTVSNRCERSRERASARAHQQSACRTPRFVGLQPLAPENPPM
jgi:hypothetical protein